MPAEYVYDPATGTAQLRSGDALGPPVDPASLLGDRYYLSGAYVIDRTNPLAPSPLGRQGEITITVLDNGVVDILSEVTARSANRPTTIPALYAVSGTANIVDVRGTARSIDISMSTIRGFSQQVYRYLDADGVEHFEALTPDSETYNARVQDYGATLRFATGKEATETALYGYLKGTGQNYVQQALSEGWLTDANGNTPDTFSGMLDLLVAELSGQYTYNKLIRFPVGAGAYGTA